MRNSISKLFAAGAALSLAACAAPEEAAEGEETAAEGEGTEAEAAGTIVDVASGNEDFSTLVTAVTAAELGETLSGEGPFTVFAPTNAAFEKLGDQVAELTKPENKETLAAVLTYHVVPGKVVAADVAKLIEEGEGEATVETVQGDALSIKMEGDQVVLTDAKGGTSTVTATDVEASNGVIHVIDTVIMPAG
ncbi:fasciclin domain-containing protein [Alterisphingorhabdus coralli]|uniref:Fasciclin domain-containing protein n=1 Tax=Alterisphingorhabdus coralli TaxID=3071408 RepID=A0AA97FBI8_9SPHN|nr:fasciclin domain-containing protein [Parasphingorhabdus sp. SCSIO 66989]WOE76015.1 fasciclin domain-containing protein [Parasphingorhabdus sp. SCSIO 66989]